MIAQIPADVIRIIYGKLSAPDVLNITITSKRMFSAGTKQRAKALTKLKKIYKNCRTFDACFYKAVCLCDWATFKWLIPYASSTGWYRVLSRMVNKTREFEFKILTLDRYFLSCQKN